MRTVAKALCFLAILCPFGGIAVVAADNLCSVPDDGTGTASLPPVGCNYLSPMGLYMIMDGLPAGTTIELAPIHHNFICTTLGSSPSHCGEPGGSLGGEQEFSESTLTVDVTGTGDLTGFSRTIDIPVEWRTSSGPRNPGESIQVFPTEMYSQEGWLYGDPDFDHLQLVAGAYNGLPSPGQTTLSLRGDGTWGVDSFFDISYRIDFIGAPGSVLEGLSGSTEGTVRIEVEAPPDVPLFEDGFETGGTTAWSIAVP